MKICLYAIAKNEIKEVDAWYESMKEADEIIVLDTGSTDGTPERLRELGVTVYEKTYDISCSIRLHNSSHSLRRQFTEGDSPRRQTRQMHAPLFVVGRR